MAIYGYIRRARRSGRSDQSFRIVRYCEGQNKRVSTTYFDLECSGLTDTASRPGFSELYSNLMPRDTIVVTDFSVLSRDAAMLVELFKDLHAMKVEVELADDEEFHDG